MTRHHDGIDLSNRNNASQPITAAASGTVVSVYTTCAAVSPGCNGGLGNEVVIRHTNGASQVYYTRYAHLRTVSVRPGQSVTLGSSIGVKGNTGNSDGAHLHFEIYSGRLGNPINPRNRISFPALGVQW